MTINTTVEGNKPKIDGIVHFWNLSSNVRIVLESSYKNKLIKKFLSKTKSVQQASKMLDVCIITMKKYLNKKNCSIKIETIIKLLKLIHDIQFTPESIEKKIIWIGDQRSYGINNPKLPLNFNCREGARFIAAICNDGWISDNIYYSNTSASLRNSVKKDTIVVFGGDKQMIHEWIKKKDQYLSFPSIIRDTIILFTKFKGVKSENNPAVPTFILKTKQNIYGWIEQTIADEGCVKHYPKLYRREIIWTRSFKKKLKTYKLHQDEKNMLNMIGIKYSIYIVGHYKTENGIQKIRKAIRISNRLNIIKLRELITIPDKRKDKLFTQLTKTFQRYKEPLKVKENIVKICKEKKYITSNLLKKEMKYRGTGSGNIWLKYYTNQGLIYLKKESYSRGIKGCVPAVYVLNS